MKKNALVEDNADTRLLVQVILGDRYEVTSYENGQEALEGIASKESSGQAPGHFQNNPKSNCPLCNC